MSISDRAFPGLTGTEAPGWRTRLGLAVLLALIFLLGLVPRQEMLVDDAFIFQTFVRNALSGHGLTYSTGQWVEGYSSPLWVLMLLGLGKLGAIGLLPAKLLGATCGAATCALLAFLDMPRRYLGLIMAAGVVLAIQTPLLWLSAVGMETPLMMLVLTALALGMVNRNLPLVIVMASLAAITRPEGPMYTVLAAFWIVGECRARNYGGRRIMVIGFLVAGPALAWEGYRLHAYGALLANSAYAKIGRDTLTGERPSGLDYLVSSFDLLTGAWILFAVGAAFTAMALRGGLADARMRAATVILLMALGGCFFAIAVGGDWMPLARFFVPLVPLMIVSPLCMVPVLTPAQFRILAFGFAAAGLAGLGRYTADHQQGKWNYVARWPASAAQLLQAQQALRQQHYFVYFMLRYTKPGDAIVHFDVGQSGYFANDLRIIDQFALVSRTEAEYLHGRHSPREMEQRFRELRPSLVFALLRPQDQGNSAFVVGQPFLSELAKNYQIVHSHRWWEDAVLMVFVRKDALGRKSDPERLDRWQRDSHGLSFSRKFLLAEEVQGLKSIDRDSESSDQPLAADK